MPEAIPDDWREDVLRILRTCDRRLIEWTPPARQRWDADTFGDAQDYGAYDAMIAALEREDVTGNETTSYPGQVGTYEFLFTFRDRPMYGKIALSSRGASESSSCRHTKPNDPNYEHVLRFEFASF